MNHRGFREHFCGQRRRHQLHRWNKTNGAFKHNETLQRRIHLSNCEDPSAETGHENRFYFEQNLVKLYEEHSVYTCYLGIG